MDVQIDLETYTLMTTLMIGGFVLGLLFATIAALDLIKVTNISAYIKTSPEAILLMSITIFILPTMSALGNLISPFLGDALAVSSFLFIFAGGLISWRSRNASTHDRT